MLKAGWKGTASTKTSLDQEIKTKIQVFVVFSLFFFCFCFFRLSFGLL